MKRMDQLQKLVCVLLAACSFAIAAEPNSVEPAQWQRGPAPALRPVTVLRDGISIEKDIVYGSQEPARQSLDIYWHKDAEKPQPLVVWIHGGAWMGGNKEDPPAVRLLDKGFAAASIHYRLSHTAKFPAQIHDCKAAIRWLRANAAKYNIDPNHIGVWGGSAGGHLVALLGTTNGNKQLEGAVGNCLNVCSDVQAVCDWFGPSDFFTMPVDKRQFNGQDPIALLLGGALSEKKEAAELASPLFQADKTDVPFLIMHGDQDGLVPLVQSQVLDEKLRSAGVDSTLIIMKGCGHGFGPGPEVYKPIEDFFERTLKQETHPLTN